MKVTRADSKSRMQSGVIKGKSAKTMDFTTTLDMANKEQTEERLQQMLDDIESLGQRLTSTRSVDDAKEYRKKVQEYLSFIVKNIYILKKESGPLNYGIHIRIEVINQKLDELTKSLIEQQKENIELADKLDEIKGLLVDAYK